jgi:hypothetical protein
VRGRVEHGLRQDLAERHHDGDVRSERTQALRPPGVAQARRLQYWQPGGDGGLLDGRGPQLLAPVRRTVGLRDDGDDLMPVK